MSMRIRTLLKFIIIYFFKKINSFYKRTARATNESKRTDGVGGINSQPITLYHKPWMLSISLVERIVNEVIACENENKYC